MAIILGIETATQRCSVALTREGKLLTKREAAGSNEHSALLTVFISEVLSEAVLTHANIDAVAVSMGPGSYTGLRIGLSTAKGLCYALDKPLIAVDTLTSIAVQAKSFINEKRLNTVQTLICPMIDARRMEVYTALFDGGLQKLEETQAAIITPAFFDNYTNYSIIVIGDGAAKCKPLFTGNPNIYFSENIETSAEAVCLLAETDYAQARFADTAYCEPFYFKDFIAGKPKVKGLYE